VTIENRREPDRALASPHPGPWKERKAEFDRDEAQSAVGLLQLHLQPFVGVESPCLGDHPLGELGVDASVPLLVGGRERTDDRCDLVDGNCGRPLSCGMYDGVWSLSMWSRVHHHLRPALAAGAMTPSGGTAC
jgi:hypothetical protein